MAAEDSADFYEDCGDEGEGVGGGGGGTGEETNISGGEFVPLGTAIAL